MRLGLLLCRDSTNLISGIAISPMPAKNKKCGSDFRAKKKTQMNPIRLEMDSEKVFKIFFDWKSLEDLKETICIFDRFDLKKKKSILCYYSYIIKYNTIYI